ncbi:MAG: RND transporter, partial [Mesorhizobium sp.]
MKPATSRRLRFARASIVVSMSAALAACVSVGPDFAEPELTLEKQWLESLPPLAQAAPSAQAAWWKAFNDPV